MRDNTQEIDEILDNLWDTAIHIGSGSDWNRNKITEAKAKLQRLMVEARISDLSDLARNCNYASSAKKVDYVPVWRIESKIEVLTKELDKIMREKNE